MSNQIIPSVGDNNQSPFDSIRRVRADGTEFWSARDLQPFMGYSKWQDFQNAVERAMTAATNAGHDHKSLFVQVSQLMDAGNLGPQKRIDFELARFACYLTFLNGDPRKPEVAAAQAYFAVRTREAETTTPALTEDEIVHQALEITTRKVAALTEKVAELESPAKAWNNLAAASGNYSVAEAAKILSQDPAISIGRGRLFAFLHEAGWIFRSRNARGGWEAYQEQVDNGRLYERPARPFLNERTGEYELPSPTIRVTVKGLERLRQMLGGGQALIVLDGGAAS